MLLKSLFLSQSIPSKYKKVSINPLLYLVPEEALLEGCLLADDAGPDGRIRGIENPRIHGGHVAGGHKHAQETVQPHRHIAVGRIRLQLGQFVVFCQPSSFCIKSCGSIIIIFRSRSSLFTKSRNFDSEAHTANEGPVRIQYKCLVPIYVFPEMKLCSLQNRIIMFCLPIPTLIYLLEIYIFPGSFCCS